MAISGSGETSCMISPIGKIGVRSSGPAGSPVRGFSGGSGSPGRSPSRLTQWVGISPSDSRNLVGWLMERSYARRGAAATASLRGVTLRRDFDVAHRDDAQLDHVAVAQSLRHHALAVDPYAVQTAVVEDHRATVAAQHDRMPARD